MPETPVPATVPATVPTTVPAAPYRVMTVCTGNICRSPMAEVVLRDRFEHAGLGDVVAVDSTGISDEEHGRPLDRRAQRVLATHGYAVPLHRARQVTPVDLTTHDLVLAMTSAHARALRNLAHGDVGLERRVRMYRSFDPAAPTGGPEHLLDVDDPWYGEEEGFEVTLEEVEAAADAIVQHVRGELERRGTTGAAGSLTSTSGTSARPDEGAHR
ncbi:MAG: protein tyrosine phosphatase [Actinotalea sp.]|nr:protein tyrosine phosphatase [Actinotalea sp.]